MHNHSHHHHSAQSREELIALLDYMHSHNASHSQELRALSDKLKAQVDEGAYNKIMLALEKYDEGNEFLSEALSLIK